MSTVSARHTSWNTCDVRASCWARDALGVGEQLRLASKHAAERNAEVTDGGRLLSVANDQGSSDRGQLYTILQFNCVWAASRSAKGLHRHAPGPWVFRQRGRAERLELRLLLLRVACEMIS